MTTELDTATEVELLEELREAFHGIDSERLSQLMDILFEVQYPHIHMYPALCHYAAIMRLAQIESGEEHPVRPLAIGVPGELRLQVPPLSRCKAA